MQVVRGNPKALKVVGELYVVEFFVWVRFYFFVGTVKSDGGLFFGVVNSNIAGFSSNGRVLRNVSAPTKGDLVPGNAGILGSERLTFSYRRRNNIVVYAPRK